VKVLITGGSGGLGLAIAAALGDAEVVSLGLEEGFDVGDADAWRAVEGEFDAAFLNAGIVTREGDMAALTDEQYRRALRANVDGVVFGVRELSARLMPNGGAIVATSSLAGLTATPMDPIYSLTKHAVIGFVRSVAPQLAAKGIRIQDEVRGLIDVPLMDPAFVADAALQALDDEETGGAWIVQPNRVLRFRFPNIPGPR